MADQPAPIIQDIIIRPQGVDDATRQLAGLEGRQRGVREAAGDTTNAMERQARALGLVSREASGAAREAERTSGAWQTFARSVGGANEGLGKITQAVQLVGGALGALVGGGVIGGAITAAITAFGQLRDIVTDEDGRLRRNVEAVRLLGQAYDEFRGKLKLVGEQITELSKAQREGVAAYARGLGISPENLSASGFLSGVGQGEADLARQKERNRLEGELLILRKRIIDAERQAADQGLPSFRRDQAVGQARFAREQLAALSEQYNALRTQIAGVGYGGRTGGRAEQLPATATWNDFFGIAAFRRFGREAMSNLSSGMDRARIDAALALEGQADRFGPSARGTGNLAIAMPSAPGSNVPPAQAGSELQQQLRSLADVSAQTTSIAIGAFQSMAGAFGQSMSQMVISGEFGARGMRRALGQVLAGVSTTAYTYAAIFGALALAGPAGSIFGISTAGLGPAAIALAAAGTGAAVAARLLGAGAGAGGAGGPVSGGAGGGGVPGGPQMQSVTNFNIVLGISRREVHDAVVEESDARGGLRSSRRVSVGRAA